MKKIYFFILVICFCNCTKENESNNDNSSFVASVVYLEDAKEVYDVNDLKDNTFTKLAHPKLSYKNGWYWFKISLNNASKKEEKLFFKILEPSVNEVAIFDATKFITSKKSTKGFPNIEIELDNQKKETQFYLKVHFKKQVHFPLQVVSLTTLYKEQEQANIGNGMYYGMVLMIFILNLIFYFTLKDTTFIYYCLFMGSINFSFTGFDGTLYFFGAQETFEPFLTISHICIQVFGALFASKFLNLHKFYPKLNNIGFSLISIPIVLYITYYLTNNFLYFAIADFIGLLVLGYYWFMGVLMYKKETFAKFFVFAYAVALFAALFFLTPLNFGLSSIALPFSVLKFGNILEMLVLTYAITYRVKLMQEENVFFNNEIKKHIQQIFELEKKLAQKNTQHTSSAFKIETIAENHQLTTRESDILFQIINGLNNNQIAEKLFISVNTVKYHTRNIYEKLDVKKRTEITTKLFLS